MTWETLQWIMGVNIVLHTLLFVASHKLHRKAAKAKASSLATTLKADVWACVEPVVIKDSENAIREKIYKCLRDRISAYNPTFPDIRLLLLRISHTLFFVFISHALVCLLVCLFQIAAAGKSHVCYIFGAIFSVLYCVSALCFLLFEGTWRLLFAFVTGEDLLSDEP